MTTKPHTSLRRRFGALLLAACYAAGLPVLAAPTVPQVVAGQASFSQQGNVFSITNTPGAIINWQSFNVGAGEITRFIQQSADSAVLNRVLGQDPTKILGALQSNGKVFLINPNGILFGANARVDVNGLVASTLDIADADFKAGKKSFQAGANTTPGSVRNDGSITTPAGGQVFLLAADVQNKGIIQAPGGQVLLAAGHSIGLADAGDPDLHVVISAPADQALNLGQVIARGGRIGILGALVSQGGRLNADSALRGAGGSIILKASRATRLGAGSVTSAVSSDGQGGAVRVLGPQIAIEGGASVDASGAAGGGSVLVGGDWQGAAGTPRAAQLTMAAGARIRADATRLGAGGKVVLWSDGATGAHGRISARGAGSGQGGQVETSGHVLDVDGIAVDARAGAVAGAGRNGSWLLDPYDIEVVASGGAAASEVASASGGAADGVTKIAPGTLAAAGADVVLQARHDLTISDAIAAAGSVRAQAGNDIRVDAQVSSQGDLDFRAGNAFSLGAGGVLKTANYIDIQANSVALAGGIAGAGGQAPVLSFSSTDPARPITVGRGAADPGTLWLDAATLGRLSGGVYEINLGNSQHTGAVSIGSSLSLSSNLVLESVNRVAVLGPVDLTARPDSRFIASLYGGSDGQIQVQAPIKAAASVLLQGDRLAIGAPLAAASVSLSPNNAGTPISVGGAGSGAGLSIGQDALALVKADTLTIGGLAGSYGALNVDGALKLAGAGSPATLVLDAGAGALNVGAGISGAGAVDLRAAGIAGSGVIQADKLSLRSTGGIGRVEAPLKTQAGSILAINQGSGSQPINIANQGALVLLGAVQAGEDNHGAIAVDSIGGMTIPAYAAASEGGAATGEVRTTGGDISLVTHSPLDILGQVATTSGNVRLLADKGGKLTIHAGASVSSGTGEVSITAGATDIASGALHVASPDKLHVADASAPPDTPAPPTPTPPTPPTPATPPTVQACVADHNVAGCADVLGKALQTCVGNPDGPLCGQVLPKLAACQAAPSTPGCSVVLARNEVDVCLANPALPGCAAKLPSYDACRAAPSGYGCGQVLQQHDAVTACIANPGAPGCGSTLPALAACRLDAGVYGCAVVLARDQIDVCLANPALPGCAARLPSYDACALAPSTYGCGQIIGRHDAVAACIANPNGAGCASTLPALAVCRLDAGVYGCAAVLQLSFQACLVHPHDASCSGILPTLGQCVAAPSRSGCEAVLPSLNQCIGSPSLQGCEVILPTLAQCAAAPSSAGCEAVLPTASFCGVHPGDASCVIFSGNGGSGSGADARGTPVAQALQGAVQLINTGAANVVPAPPGQQEQSKDEGKDKAGAERLAGPATAQQTGTKNAKPATKTYCN